MLGLSHWVWTHNQPFRHDFTHVQESPLDGTSVHAHRANPQPSALGPPSSPPPRPSSTTPSSYADCFATRPANPTWTLTALKKQISFGTLITLTVQQHLQHVSPLCRSGSVAASTECLPAAYTNSKKSPVTSR